MINPFTEGDMMPRPPESAFETSKLTAVLKAMSNLRRMQILSELSDGAEKSVSQIETVIPNYLNQLSQHLAKLRKSNLVTTRRDLKRFFIQ